MSNTNTQTIENAPRQRGRQPGQKVWSLDFRAFRALNAFDFSAHGLDVSGKAKDDLILGIIAHLREEDIF